jgi:hypothetical protein
MQGKEDCRDPTFYTDYGEIRCKTVKGKKRFVFYNPTLPESNKMVAFMKTFVGIANYLPEAQQVAAKYLLERKPAAADAADFEKGGGASGEGAAAAAAATADSPQSPSEEAAPSEAEQNEDALFSKILYVFGNKPPIRVMLTVSPFKERPYIWLKRMWLEEKEQPSYWIPCKGGFRFSVSDDGHEMHRFAKKCMLEEEGRKQYMREKLERRALYHERPAAAEDCPSPPKKRHDSGGVEVAAEVAPEAVGNLQEQSLEQDTQELVL